METASGISVVSKMALTKAENRPLSKETLTKQLGRLGNTPFCLESLDNDLQGDVILPLSELNRLRRELVAKLQCQEVSLERSSPHHEAADWRQLLPSRDILPAAETVPSLSVLCRTESQLQAAIRCGSIARIYLDFEDVRRYRDAVRSLRDSPSKSTIFLATPRIQKSGEEGFFKLIERAEPDGVLVRNLGAVQHFSNHPLRAIGDFSLNVSNPITARMLHELGLELLTISYDLNLSQVLDFVKLTPPAWLEITLHQHMPMFHMEHCVFCAFMSKGKDYTDCGRPCEQHEVSLRDRVGMLHPLAADVGCRNTLFHGKAQSGARFYPQLQASGLHQFRIELLRETADEATRMIQLYSDLLAGAAPPSRVHSQLRADSKLGVTVAK